MEFSDLGVDCLFLILEKLDFFSLVTIASVNKAFSALAANVFLRKYANRIIVFQEPCKLNDKYSVVTYNDSIFIYDFAVVLSVLRHFGSHIFDLEIQYKLDKNNKLKRIIGLVNQHCENLSKFHLETYTSDAFEGVKKPFESITQIGLIGSLNKIGNDTFSLNEMFPKLRQLNLNVLELDDSDCINTHIPHLDSLNVRFSYQIGLNESQIANLILKNPQIRHLHLDYINSSFIDFVSKNLPNLEQLYIPEIISVDYNGRIHFKNVKTFRLGSTGGRLIKVTFGKLEVFHCDVYNFPWLHFIRFNRNLKKLFLAPEIIVSNHELSMIAFAAPNLIEATLRFDDLLRADILMEFLDDSRHLNLLHFSLVHASKFSNLKWTIENIKNALSNEWTMKQKTGEMFLIERKNWRNFEIHSMKL